MISSTVPSVITDNDAFNAWCSQEYDASRSSEELEWEGRPPLRYPSWMATYEIRNDEAVGDRVTVCVTARSASFSEGPVRARVEQRWLIDIASSQLERVDGPTLVMANTDDEIWLEPRDWEAAASVLGQATALAVTDEGDVSIMVSAMMDAVNLMIGSGTKASIAKKLTAGDASFIADAIGMDFSEFMAKLSAVSDVETAR
ncbi:hypothetical protein [Microbacterium sp. A1-JK]|uniref:hypothetical protein n=1 Tax=Microbacterium sp. A1-JK TaxID=3177516 RepID=UPI0038881833